MTTYTVIHKWCPTCTYSTPTGSYHGPEVDGIRPVIECTDPWHAEHFQQENLCCHRGYVVLSSTRPMTYCTRCPLGQLAREMDADPLDNRKATAWEQGCRARRARLREADSRPNARGDES